MKNNRGFTLIELILYVAIVTIMLTALIPFSWNIIDNGAKSATQQELSSNARYVSERIEYEIRRASGLTSVSPATVSLMNFPPDNTTVIDLSGGKIRVNKNGTGAVNLNSEDTSVTSLTFTNYTSTDNKTRHIQYAFTMQSNFAQTRQEFRGSVTLEGSAEIRSN